MRKSRIFLFLAILGPGVVAANAGNDAAGIATYASAGSQFVYRTLFFMVLVTVALVLVQEMAVRLGTYTGKGLAALIREQFSLRFTALALGCVLLANTGLVVSEFAGIGAAFGLLGVSRYIIIPIAAVAIWALVLFGSYRYAERIFLVMSLAFLAYPIAAILGHPDWAQVGANLAIPHFEYSKAYLLLGVALIGTTVSPYMQLYAAAGVVDKGADPADYPRARIDAISGAVFACIVSITIIIATAAAIGGKGPLTSASEAAQALRPVAGSAAEVLFAFGLIGASALAGAIVPLSSAYAISEAVGVERSVSRRFTEARLFLGLFTVQVIIGAVARADPHQPDHAAHRHPGAAGHRDPGHPRLHPDPHQPAQRAGEGREQAGVPHRRHDLRRGHLGDEPAAARLDRARVLRHRLSSRSSRCGCQPHVRGQLLILTDS